MRLHRGARAARGVLVALFATFVALMSHVAAGGVSPGWLGLVAPLVLAAAVSTVLAGKRLSMPRLVVSVVASQLLFHTLFTLGGPDGTHLIHGHGHGQHAFTFTADVATLSADHTHGPGVMWLAHAVAAIVTITGLYVGERSVLLASAAVAAARAWLRRVVAVVIDAAGARPAAAAQVIARLVRMLRSLCVLTGNRLRGPPHAFGI